jgi:PadR family transcriptional regulator, regulatory protein PadR
MPTMITPMGVAPLLLLLGTEPPAGLHAPYTTSMESGSAADGLKSRTKLGNRPLLGEFEHQVMVAVRDCSDEAYGLHIAKHLLEIYGGSLAIAQVYVTLRRLEQKGFLSSRMDVPKPVRGGRARRIFLMEGKGALALEQSTAFRSALAASSKGVASGVEKDGGSPNENGEASFAPAPT